MNRVLLRIWAELTAERDVRALLLLSILPWLLVLAAVSSMWVVLIFLGLTVALTGIGSLVLIAFPRSAQSASLVLLAPACGFVVLAGVLTYGAHLGLGLRWGFLPLVVLGFLAIFLAPIVNPRGSSRRIAAGWLLVLVAVMVCASCFLPPATGDAVRLEDGSFRWMYPDTQYFMAVAATLKADTHPPRMPGLVLETFSYHFGAYAVSAAVSRTTGIEVADATARIVRGVGQWALVLAAACLGAVLASTRGGARLAAPLSAFALVFTGAITAFFANHVDSASHRSGALLMKLPFAVGALTGPFTHIMFGHSVLWGLLGLLSVFALLVAFLETAPSTAWRLWPVGLIAVFSLASNGPAGLASIGIVLAAVTIASREQMSRWPFSVALLVVAASAYCILGYAGGASTHHVDSRPASAWLSFMLWVFLGLGIKMSAFSWLRQARVGLVLATAILGFAGFNLVLEGSGDDYGIRFLEPLLTVFSFATIALALEDKGMAWRERVLKWSESLLRIVFRVALVLGLGSSLLLLISLLGGWFRRGVVVPLIAALAVIAGLRILRFLLERHGFMRAWLGVALAVILFLQATAWVEPWLTYGQNLLDVDVRVGAGEVAGLRAIRGHTESTALFATNRHSIESSRLKADRSYMYRALSERAFLLEGWVYGECNSPLFEKVRQNNETLFATDDTGEFRRIVDEYGLDYVVARPGTDIRLTRPLPPWLSEVADMGTLRVYRVRGNGSDLLQKTADSVGRRIEDHVEG